MNQILQEYVDSRGLQVQIDRAAGVIRGVKILGLKSRNNRVYLPQALSESVSLYQGAKVNVNHARGAPFAPRDYQDRLGAIRDVRFQASEGLFGDLHFNPKHAVAEQLAWDAEHAPENVGLSHNVQARTSVKDGQTVVEAIASVHSVDLVADPATTRGLFEESDPATSGQSFDRSGETCVWSQLTVAALRERRADLIDEVLAEQNNQQRELERQLDRLEAAAALSQRQLLVNRLLQEHGLPIGQPTASDSILGERFYNSLLVAASEAQVRELIADRVALLRQARALGHYSPRAGGQPRSCDQLLAESRPTLTVDEFVRAIT